MVFPTKVANLQVRIQLATRVVADVFGRFLNAVQVGLYVAIFLSTPSWAHRLKKDFHCYP
jgi:Sec-independent protein secretion pathway component TatC